MNKRQAKKRDRFHKEQSENIILGLVPKNWTQLRCAKQIKNGKLHI